jgi:poly(3-hydroxybutyrate) depolymerase
MAGGLVLQWIIVALVAWAAAGAQAVTSDDRERSIDDPRVEHRSYVFPGTGEEIPYALFVPPGYDAERPVPLLVSLHGLGRTYDWLMGYHGLLDLADSHGFLVVTPLGYTRRGWYGARSTDVDGRGLGAEAERSEQDVMNVLARVRDEFDIDPERIYLWGHSMGGAGTLHLAAKYPDLWAGIGLVAPATPEHAEPDTFLPRISHIPAIVLHGTHDELIPVTFIREWVAAMANLGMQHVYVEIEGGDHSLLISQNAANMRKIVDFLGILCRCERWKPAR